MKTSIANFPKMTLKTLGSVEGFIVSTTVVTIDYNSKDWNNTMNTTTRIPGFEVADAPLNLDGL